MDIKRICTKIMRRYGTNNPFTLADKMNIIVRYDNLGSTWGFFFTYKRTKIININSAISEELQRFTCAHELGHTLLHKDISTPFLKVHTLFSIDKIERQANTFAVELLMPDELIRQYEGLPLSDISYTLGIPLGMEVLKR